MLPLWPSFAAVLVSFCGVSYLEVVNSRNDQVPTKADFLAALLPLICIPALLSLCSGLFKWYVNLHDLYIYAHSFDLIPYIHAVEPHLQER